MKKANLVLIGALVISILFVGCGNKDSKVNTQTNGTENRVNTNYSSTEANNSKEQSQQQKVTGENQKNIETKTETAENSGKVYTNSKYKFSITFPDSWKGKYLVEEDGNQTFIRHKSRSIRDGKKVNGTFFLIEPDQGEGQKIGTVNGVSFVAITPSQAQYFYGEDFKRGLSANELKKYDLKAEEADDKEFQAMFASYSEIIKTFRNSK